MSAAAPHLPISRGGRASSAPFFRALRRMRPALMGVIVVYAVGVLGLTLIPGIDDEGQPRQMSAFDAFYFITFTATTIGFGEIPHPFTPLQRLWVIVTIYGSVVAWGFAFGKVISIIQERGFRESVARVRFEREVARLREPFLLIAGYGRSGEMLTRSLDAMDRRMVVLDSIPERIDALDVASFRFDVPGLVADVRSPYELERAGLLHPMCQGVIALTDDDEVNLAITMSAALLRPGLPVVTRSTHSDVERRMAAFGDPLVVDPFNLFGDELMLALRSPDLYRMIQWLTSDAGTVLEPRLPVPGTGHWIIAGYGRFGSHLAHDLLSSGLSVTVVDEHATATREGMTLITGDANDREVLIAAGIESATAFAAATDNDTDNISLLVAAEHINPALFRVGRQNEPMNSPLFGALGVESVLVPTALVAHEVLQRVGNPLLWQFVESARQRDDGWATPLLDRLVAAMGDELASIWELRVDRERCPAVADVLGQGRSIDLGAILSDPGDRDIAVEAVPLLISNGGRTELAPDPSYQMQPGDRVLLAGTAHARGTIDTTVSVPTALAYTSTGRRVGSSWLWRTFVDK